MTPAEKKASPLEVKISELVDFSGCVSGDCNHVRWADCAEHYKVMIRDFILELAEVKGLVEALRLVDSLPGIAYAPELNRAKSSAAATLTAWRSFRGEK